MRVVDYVRGDPMKRHILDAVRINEFPEEKRIKDKTEWCVGKLPNMEVNEG